MVVQIWSYLHGDNNYVSGDGLHTFVKAIQSINNDNFVLYLGDKILRDEFKYHLKNYDWTKLRLVDIPAPVAAIIPRPEYSSTIIPEKKYYTKIQNMKLHILMASK